MLSNITLVAFLTPLPDPRYRRARRHPLLTVLFVSLCAVLAGANSLTEIERWAKARESRLRERIDLPGGVPSHDTIGRVLARLDPQAFDDCFRSWTQALHQKTDGEVIALDGKTISGRQNHLWFFRCRFGSACAASGLRLGRDEPTRSGSAQSVRS